MWPGTVLLAAVWLACKMLVCSGMTFELPGNAAQKCIYEHVYEVPPSPRTPEHYDGCHLECREMAIHRRAGVRGKTWR